jgi:hypothetical protein
VHHVFSLPESDRGMPRALGRAPGHLIALYQRDWV